MSLSVACVLAAMACGGERQPGILTLLDAIPDSVPAGPWRVLAMHDARYDGPDAVWGEGAGKGGTDGRINSHAVTLSSGSTIVVRIDYGRRWGAGGTVTARLLDNGRAVAAVSQPLGRGWAELRLPSSGVTAGWLQVVHRGIEEPVPLRSMVALEMPGAATPGEMARASAFAALAAQASRSTDRACLMRRKGGVVREGSRREAVALASGDTVTFDLPPTTSRMRLRFWLTGLRVLPDGESVVSVAASGREGWRTVASWKREDTVAEVWSEMDLGAWLQPGTRGVRFVLGGRDEVVAIGSPILIPDRAERVSRKNVILIDLDTMRADRLGAYGYTERPTSVRLDSLLEVRGFVVFRRAYSAAPWTLPSTAKFMISRYHNVDRDETVPREYTTLAEMLRWCGYYCAAFTGGGVLRFPGFEQGFHQYYWSEDLGDGFGKVEHTFSHAAQWLRLIDAAPFFLFVHTYEPHTPYTRDVFCRGLPHGRLGDVSASEPLLPSEMIDREHLSHLTREESLYVQAAYDGGVKAACDATVDLLSVLDRRGLWENTVVVILSDHGEEFWEHSETFADHLPTSTYGEVIDVPLIIRDPRRARRGMGAIDTEVSTVDLLPTIADLLGVPPPEGCDGTSLAPVLEGGRITRHIPIMVLTQPGDPRVPVRRAIIENGLKYHEALTVESGEGCPYPIRAQLYDVRRDPGETDNLIVAKPETAHELLDRLRKGVRAATAPLEASPDSVRMVPPGLRNQLRALGYLE